MDRYGMDEKQLSYYTDALPQEDQEQEQDTFVFQINKI